MHILNPKLHKNKFKIEERRRQVSNLLAQSLTELEISNELGVNQSTISRDIQALKEMSNQFIFDLAKSDLAFYYLQCIEGVEQIKRKTWDIFKEQDTSTKDKLYALKIIKECNESKFNLFKEGPSIMNVKSLEDRMIKIESSRQVNS